MIKRDSAFQEALQEMCDRIQPVSDSCHIVKKFNNMVWVKEEIASMPLRLPNRSVEAAFRQEVWDFLRDKMDNAFVRDFISALWAGEEKNAEAAICQILEMRRRLM